jgi:hypothetical protein
MSDWGSLGNMDNSLGSVRNLAGGGITWGMIQYEMHAYEYVQYDACSMMTLGICHWNLGLMLWLGAEHGRALILWGMVVKVWYLGIFDPSAFATTSSLEASNGWVLMEFSTSRACMGSWYVMRLLTLLQKGNQTWLLWEFCEVHLFGNHWFPLDVFESKWSWFQKNFFVLFIFYFKVAS